MVLSDFPAGFKNPCSYTFLSKYVSTILNSYSFIGEERGCVSITYFITIKIFLSLLLFLVKYLYQFS